MKHKVINLNIDYKKLGVENNIFNPSITLYLPDNFPEINMERKRPTVIICPGGAYHGISDREAEPIALNFAAKDFNAIVLRYSCAPITFPCQLLELSAAVAMVRENADEWNVDINKIIVAGFSAGGHLAATLGCYWNKDFVKDFFGFAGGENKPDGLILCYPVITSGEMAHRFSFELLLGDKKDDEEALEMVSLEKQVNDDTPKTFIWHTFEDTGVPVENSYLFASALKKYNIQTEMHIFPRGDHALSLCTDSVFAPGHYNGEADECRAWFEMAVRWIENL